MLIGLTTRDSGFIGCFYLVLNFVTWLDSWGKWVFAPNLQIMW